MRLQARLFCLAVILVAISSEERSEKKIVCYYTNWSVYRPGTAKFSPQNINPYLCTHLVYAFGGLTKDNSLKPFDKYQDIEQGGYAKFNGLKTYNKNLKTMVAVGGWNEGSARFSPLVADSERRRELVKNTIKFLRQNHFDGLDLDWEYPSFRDGGKPRDRDNYAQLVQELREEFDRESEKTGRPRLLLTMAVPAGIEYIDKGYDVPKLNRYLDWMNILSYDYHSAFEPSINHHSPLFSLEEDDEYNFDAQLNIDHTIEHYLKLGADKSKLVLGIPTYGRSYTLFNPDATDIGSPADGPGEQGDATREKGYLAYYEICEKISNGGWTVKNLNPKAMGPYAFKGNQWVGYDDEEIARAKSRYVNEKELGGIMFWSIDNDDFRGKCHGKPYPLIEAAKEALLADSNELVPVRQNKQDRTSSRRQESETTSRPKNRKTRPRPKTSTTTTEAPTTKRTTPHYSTTTPLPPTTPDPGSDFVCKDEGFFPHPRDCKKYFWCLDSGPSSLGIVAHQFTCPSGLVFNKISDSCDYARNVICKNKDPVTTAATSTTTTEGTTTTRGRNVITASPPRSTTTRTTTTTTTTTTTEEPVEYEEYDEEEAEDPNTIKELITLIKKLGGVEQLEKQLNIQDSDEHKKIKQSNLYNKVLNGRTGNRFRGASEEQSTSRYTSLFRNRAVGGQNSQSEEEVSSTRNKNQEKPQYVTINRNRSSTKAPVESEEEEDEEEEEESEEVRETSTQSRRRPGSSVSTEKEYVTLRRGRPQNNDDSSTPRYKTIHRARSTTEASVEETEEDISEEVEEETEPVQKSKKYSSVIRENKRVASEGEDSKVSGRQGPQFEKEETTTVTHLTRTTVNSVHKGSTPKYVEIRRGHTRTDSETTTTNDVNSVNNSNESTEENATSTEEAKTSTELSSTQKLTEPKTTEATRRRTRFPIRTSTTEKPEESSQKPSTTESARFRGRLRVTTEATTEADLNLETPNRFRISNRNRSRKPVESTEPTEKESTKPAETSRRRGGSFRTSTSTTTTEAISSASTTEASPRRFQFASRSKPKILTPSVKPQNESKDVDDEFTIVVPDTTYPTTFDYSTTDDSALTTETTELDSTVTDPTLPDVTDYMETNLPVTSFQRSKVSKQQQQKTTVPMSTSTETSVVTSVTESLITERVKIMVTKKPHFKTAYQKLKQKTTTTSTTPIPTQESSTTAATRPYRIQKYKKSTVATTPRTEIRGRSFNRFAARSTTTAAPEISSTEGRFVPKRARGFKKFSDSTEQLETPVSSERTGRFKSRGRENDRTKNLDNNILSKRTGEVPRRRLKPLIKNKDDLETQQSGAFYEDEDDIEDDQKFILGGTIKQTSGKDFLTADVLLVTVPSVEEEEKATEQELEERKSTLVDPRDVNKDFATSQEKPPQGEDKSINNKLFRGRARKIKNESNEKTEDHSRSRSFRGRVKAKDSLRENVSNDLLDGNKLERSKTTFRSRVTELTPSSEADFGNSSETEAQTEGPTSTTARPATALFRRGGGQDYLTNLRSRTRSTTTTTSTTERPARRPGVQLDRRRKFRPETRTTTTRSEPQTEGTNATKGLAFPRRRVRPSTTEATSSSTQQDDSHVEESKDNAGTPDLSDLADPAVVAIHNLATVSPVPVAPSVSTTPIRVASQPPSTFTIQVSPVTESSLFTATLGAFAQSPVAINRQSTLISNRPFTSSPIARQFTTQTTASPITHSTLALTRATPEPVTEVKSRSEVVIQPRRQETSASVPPAQAPRKLKPFSKVPRPGIVQAVSRPNSQPLEYEYYDSDADIVDDPLAEVPPSALKVKVHSDGYIECLDRGNFPHPFSCKKFISCAKMENNELLGWEYTCPKHLSFDPVGGICNWSAGLGCQH